MTPRGAIGARRVALLTVLVVAIGAAPRIALAAGALPDALRPFVWSDALFTFERGLSGHRLPYVDTPFEYPPLIGALSGLLSLVASGPVAYVAYWAAILAVAAAVCAILLVRAADATSTLRYWVLAPQLLLLGSLNFDVLPTALLVGATVAQRRGNDLSAAAALALGTATKFFPLASVPIAFLRSRVRATFACVVAAALATAYVPTMAQPHSSAGGVAYYLVGIDANIDSVWGILERLLAAVGVPAPSVVIVVVTLAGLAATYVLLVLPRALRSSDPAVGFCLATVALLFWSRLYSPQYSLWLLPFFALLGLGGRRFALLTVADVGVFFTIYPLTLVRHGADDPVAIVLLGALALFVVMRHVALISIWRAVVQR